MMTAKLNNLRIAPRKVRLMADVVRDMPVLAAQKQLALSGKKTAGVLLKLLNSAIANAVHNKKLKEDNLFIKEIRVNEGVTLKRWMPRAFGRASAKNKRTSHVLIGLEEIEKTQLPTQGKKEALRQAQDKVDKKEEVKVVKSLDEIKEMTEKDSDDELLKETDESKAKIQDKNKQHDQADMLKKETKGHAKKSFRRKSV